MNPRQSPLWIFIGLALLIHLGVLAWFQSRPSPIEIRLSNQTASLSVSLRAIEVHPQPPAAASTSKPEAGHKPTPVPARQSPAPRQAPGAKPAKATAKPPETHPRPAQPAPDTLAKTPPATADTPVATAGSTTATEAKPALDRARVLSQLRQDMRQYFYYPRLARRNNMQGTVTLGFGINPQGRIHNIRVIRSSGHAILDMAAEDALGKVQQLNWIHNRWQPDFAHLELPVIYRLMEN